MKFLLAVALSVLAACSSVPAGPLYVVSGVALAGPVCPVETDPPQPGCEPRPVAGAELIVRDEKGDEVLVVETATDGTFSFEIAAGNYVLEPQAVEGLMGTAPPLSFEVVAGPIELPPLLYDTGIR